jgi:hypothetical protein
MAARVAVEADLDELDAALVLVDRVIEAEAKVELVVEPALVRAILVDVVREGVDVQVEIESAALIGGGRARGRAETQHQDPLRVFQGGASMFSAPQLHKRSFGLCASARITCGSGRPCADVRATRRAASGWLAS